jgi:thiamine kinase-like enzyme
MASLHTADRYHFQEDVAAETRVRARALLDDWALPDLRGPLVLETLPGGANNINLIVRGGQRPYVLKMRATGAAELNMGLAAAVTGQRQAARQGIAPTVYADSPEGDFLSEYVDSLTLRPALIRQHRCLAQIAGAVRTLHGMPLTVERVFDVIDDARVFIDGALKHGARFDAEFELLWTLSEEFDRLLKSAHPPSGFVHGDLVPQNILLCADGLKFVDFDYCGSCMFAADLAIHIGNAKLDDAEIEELLLAYDPDLDDGQRARVWALVLINAVREISWAIFAEARISGHTALFDDWSYADHAKTNLEAARHVMGLAAFSRLRENMVNVRPGALF